MRAVVHTAFGPARSVRIGDVERPAVSGDGVLVRVRAASVNPADWFAVVGQPYIARPEMGLRRPKAALIGVDFAGTVEEVGAEVTGLRPGDEVFGGKTGALAEYVAVRVAVARKPANISFEEAAAVPVAGLTALQGLRDHGGVGPGMKVLINGASGGVGTFAVQIAKALGASVTAVCSTRNVDIVRSLGAERVVDYTREDFTLGGERHDVMLDVAGSRRWKDVRRVLTPDARVIIVGGPKTNRFLGPLAHVAGTYLASLRSPQNVKFFIAKMPAADLAAIADLVEHGHVRPVIDKTWPFERIGEALDYLGAGHARGKVVVTL